MAKRKLSRRSFMAQVTGRAVLLGSALALVAPRARAQVTDTDPSDPAGQGRGPNAPRTGTGITDRDPSDPVGGGRGNRPGQNVNPRAHTGITDSDSGSNADPVGGGRGSGPVQNQAQQRCAADRSRAQAIQYQLSQFPYWNDNQINAAGQTYNSGIAALARQRSEAAENRAGLPDDVETQESLPRGYDEAIRSYGVTITYPPDAALAALRRLIDQALAARGQRQALERELYGLQQRIASYC